MLSVSNRLSQYDFHGSVKKKVTLIYDIEYNPIINPKLHLQCIYIAMHMIVLLKKKFKRPQQAYRTP